MKLYLIRHGRQCSQLCNVNVDLAEEGFRQAELLGKRLAGEKIEAVYSSHLLRAVQTAETANRFWNAEHIIKEELREISFGEMEGMCDEDIAVKFAAFKKEQETNLSAYIQLVRLQHASELISSTSLPIEKISRKVGYNNVGFFYKKFYEIYQTTPNEVREK